MADSTPRPRSRQSRTDAGRLSPRPPVRKGAVGHGHPSVDSSRPVAAHGDAGSILILALVFLVAVSLVALSLASWATNDLNNTANFQNAGARLYAAEGVTQVAMRASRYTYEPAGGYVCPGATSQLGAIDGLYIEDWCVNTPHYSLTVTRQITLTACLLPSATSTLTGACQINGTTAVPILLTAVVDFDDNTGSNPAVPNCTSTANQWTCGAYMTIVSWKAQQT